MCDKTNSRKQTKDVSMVSALTGRLLAGSGYSSGGSLDSYSKKRKEIDSSSGGASSGYAADVDQVGRGGHPPMFVDLQTRSSGVDKVLSSKTESFTGGNDKISSKRRKAMEKDYAAYNVKEELSRGGIAMPEPRLVCPRLLPPLCGIDMSRVALVKSKEFAPKDYISKSANRAMMKQDHKEICFESILSLTASCKGFYQLKTPEAKNADGDRSDDGNSTTSSVSDSGAGSGSGSEDDEAPKPFMAMCEALSLCKQPRIVVLSSAPFTVVHVNAAYLQLTGLSSVRLLGQPFQDLILDGKWTAALSRSTPDGRGFDLRDMHKKVVKTRSGAQKGSAMQCVVSASPIGVSEERITHFALVLEERDGADQSTTINMPVEESMASAMTVSG